MAAVAGCLAGNTTKGTPGTGGHAPDDEHRASGAPACAVTSDVALGTEEASSPVIAFGAGHYAAAWTEQGTELHVSVFDAGGQPAGTTVIPADHPVEPAVTAQAGGFLVVAGAGGRARRSHPGRRRAGRRLRSRSPRRRAGTLGQHGRCRRRRRGRLGRRLGRHRRRAERGPRRRRNRAPGRQPSLAAAAGGLGLAFTTGSQVGFARLSLPLRAASPVTFRDAPGKANLPRVSAAGDGSFFVVWEDGRGGDGNEAVYLTRVGKDGKPSGEVAVAGDGGSADYPRASLALGAYAAVVYYQFRDGPSEVYLALVGPDLRKAGPDLRISGKEARFPRAAAGDGGLGVVYALNGGPARLARVTCH